MTSGVAAAQAGDTVMIRGGTYQEKLAPPRSGSPDKHIIIKNYPGETHTLSNVDSPAIFLLNKNYLIIEGLTISDVLGWGRIENSHFNIIGDFKTTRLNIDATRKS